MNKEASESGRRRHAPYTETIDDTAFDDTLFDEVTTLFDTEMASTPDAVRDVAVKRPVKRANKATPLTRRVR